MSTAEVAATLRGARRGMATWADRHIRWTLVAPVVILILLVSIFPLGYSLWLSFVQFDFRVEGHPWNDFQNYIRVIKNTVAQASLWRTVALAAVVVAVELVLGLLLALAMVRPFRGRRFLIPIFILPLFMAPVVVGQIWRLLWDTQFGPVNYILSLIWPGDVDDHLVDPVPVELDLDRRHGCLAVDAVHVRHPPRRARRDPGRRLRGGGARRGLAVADVPRGDASRCSSR